MVEVKNIKLGPIPCLIIKPSNFNGELPTIFLYHGWSSQKANYEFMGKVIAIHGYQVIAPDALDHGERGSLNYTDLGIMEEHFWQVVINSVNEFNLLVEEGKKELGLDPLRTAVMGSSMGGIIASGILARDKRIKTLINMNGASAWEDAEQRVRVLRDVDRAATIGLETIRSYDPIQWQTNLYPRPILIQHGECDSSIPIETQIYFYDQVVEYYREKLELIRFSLVKNLNHHKTIGMLEEAIHWLNRYV